MLPPVGEWSAMTARSKIILIILIFVLAVGSAGAWYLLCTTRGLTFAASFYALFLPVKTITAGSIEGNLLAGARFINVEASEIEALPGSVIRVQEATLAFRRPWGLDIAVKNGRCELPTGEAIYFAGSLRAGVLNANVYSGGLNVQTILKILAGARLPGAVSGITGRISGMDLFVSNTIDDVRIEGAMRVDELLFRNFSAFNVPVKAELDFFPRPGSITGRISAGSGTLVARNARMEIREGNFDFSGDPANPSFKVSGNTVIGDTRINAVFSGNARTPGLQLSSQPPLPQERLMIMLLTGRSWQDSQNALARGRVTPGMVSDFAGFFLFGRSMERLKKDLGITGIEIQYERGEKAIEVHKAISRSADLIYGVAETEGAGGVDEKERVQTLGLEYRLNDTLSIEGKKQVKEKNPGSVQDVKPPESVIRLKFKKNF